MCGEWMAGPRLRCPAMTRIRRMNQELLNVFNTGKEAPAFDRIRISLA